MAKHHAKEGGYLTDLSFLLQKLRCSPPARAKVKGRLQGHPGGAKDSLPLSCCGPTSQAMFSAKSVSYTTGGLARFTFPNHVGKPASDGISDSVSESPAASKSFASRAGGIGSSDSVSLPGSGVSVGGFGFIFEGFCEREAPVSICSSPGFLNVASCLLTL